MKLESYNLHNCKKNCRKLVFLEFPEQLLSHIIFELLHCYKVTLVNKPYSKSGTKIFDLKGFRKKLVPSQREKYSGALRLNQIKSTLPQADLGLLQHPRWSAL